METFATAYAIVWGTLLLYVVRMEIRQRRLLRRLDDLESRSEPAATGDRRAA